MKRAILLVDHGSRLPEANAQLTDVADAIRSRAPERIVAVAHLDVGEPDIAPRVASRHRQVSTGGRSCARVRSHRLRHDRSAAPSPNGPARRSSASVMTTNRAARPRPSIPATWARRRRSTSARSKAWGESTSRRSPTRTRRSRP
ncbi:MAG: hypothetical protein GY725_20170 [bacterium]|nr:hypothetical protein [bacterium]